MPKMRETIDREAMRRYFESLEPDRQERVTTAWNESQAVAEAAKAGKLTGIRLA